MIVGVVASAFLGRRSAVTHVGVSTACRPPGRRRRRRRGAAQKRAAAARAAGAAPARSRWCRTPSSPPTTAGRSSRRRRGSPEIPLYLFLGGVAGGSALLAAGASSPAGRSAAQRPARPRSGRSASVALRWSSTWAGRSGSCTCCGLQADVADEHGLLDPVAFSAGAGVTAAVEVDRLPARDSRSARCARLLRRRSRGRRVRRLRFASRWPPTPRCCWPTPRPDVERRQGRVAVRVRRLGDPGRRRPGDDHHPDRGGRAGAEIRRDRRGVEMAATEVMERRMDPTSPRRCTTDRPAGCSVARDAAPWPAASARCWLASIGRSRSPPASRCWPRPR